MKNLKPITRHEQFLQDIADGEVDLKPITRQEYFLAKIAESGGGGGSSLPSYTSSDVGKVLTVGEGELVETVVAPEQTVTLTAEIPYSALTGTIDSAFQNIREGATATAVINGTTYQAIGIVAAGSNMTAYKVDELHAFFTYAGQLGVTVFGIEDTEFEGGSYTVSLTAEVPKPELKWDDDTLLITVEAGTSDTTYAQAKEALINGKNVKIMFIQDGVVKRTGVGTSFVYDESSAFPYQIKYFSVNADYIAAASEDGKLGSR